MITVEITCPAPEEFISEITQEGIILSSIRQLDACRFSACVNQMDLAALYRLTDFRANTVKICRKNPFSGWTVYLLMRPVLLVGMLTVIILTIFLPRKILFMEVEGNRAIPSSDIIACAESAGVSFGVNRSSVRSEKVKNRLLSELPGLQWAAINTYGCLAVISVKERTLPEQTETKGGVSSIVSGCDGVVCKITVKRGTAVCSVGEAVKKGQMLVSGYTDCGLLVKAEQAEAHVYAYTQHYLTAVSMQERSERSKQTKYSTSYSLKIGKKLIKMNNCSSNSSGNCAKIYSETILRLPGGFILPISLIKVTQITYTEELFRDGVDCSAWLPVYMENYLHDHIFDGEILKRTYIDDVANESWVCRCQYYCREMIGRQKDEEILK